MGGSWYGVRTVDGMEVRERLNPANANTYPNPDYRYQTVGKGTPTFTEGSAGNVQIAGSARPEAPGPGSSKAAITAYGEAAASWEREQLWRGIDPSMSYQDIASSWDNIRFDVPTQERRQYEISQSLLPQGTTSKQASIEAQYAAQRGTIVSSSGTLRPSAEGYRYSSGELFAVTPTGPAASPGGISGPSLPSPAQLPSAGVGMIGMIAREKLGMDYISGGNMLTSALQANKAPAVTGPIIPTETKLAIRNVALTLPGIRTVWSAGEYIGLDYLLGVKTAEYNKQYSALESQGLISGSEFRGSEAQYNSLNAKYQQIESLQKLQGVALDRTLGINVAEAQAGERWKVPGTQFEPATAAYDFGHGLTTQLSGGWKGIQGGIGKTFEPVAPVAVTMVAGGMMMTGMSPQVIPHTLSFVKGFGQGVAATPEFIGMAVVGAEGLIKYPQAVPGAAILGGYIQAKGIYEGVTTRPVEFAGEMYGTALALGAVGRVSYAASPVKYTAAAFEARGMPTATYRGLYAESPIRGLRNLALGGVEGLGTRQIGGITSYEGGPWYRPTVSRGTPSHLVDYLGEGYPDYPALGVKIALTQERLTREGNLPDLVSFRQELQTMDQLFRIRPSTIKNPYQEIQNIHGMTEGAGRDFLTTLRDRFPTHRVGGSLGQAVQSRFSRAAADIDLYLPQEQIPAGRTFVAEWNRRHGTTIKVDIHEYPQPGSFIGRYGIRTEKDITVEGINMMPVREQALRKLSQPMMLRNVEGAWRILPEAHRGKDIADTIGALQSEMYRLQESPVSFLHRGRMQGLQESIDVQMGKMQPGALPVERIGGRTYDPSGAAATRYRQYRWDLTESPYVKIPGTRTYFDPTPYTERVGATYARFGVPANTPWGVILETGVKLKTDKTAFPEGIPTTNIRAIQEIPFEEYPSTFKPPQASGVLPFVTYPAAKVLPTIPAHFKVAYPSGVPQPAAEFGSLIGYSPALKKQPDRMKQFTTSYPDITRFVPGKYPGIVPPGVPTQYPPFTPPGKTPYPGITKTGITPYPGITKIIPEKYPGITKTGITPYPGITKIIPEKYPGVRITGGGGKTITGITTGGFGGFKIEEFITETTRQFIPKTTPAPITIPHRWLTLTEEKPKKKPGIRMAPDVLASAWNIESPIPRIRQAFGYNIGMPLSKRQHRNELAISNIQKSRIPTRYVWKMPFEQFAKIDVKVKKVI